MPRSTARPSKANPVTEYRKATPRVRGCRDCAAASLQYAQACKQHTLERAIKDLRRLQAVARMPSVAAAGVSP